MTRQVTDQQYIELDYFNPEEYFVYTAEAQSTVEFNSTMSVESTVVKGTAVDIVVSTALTVTLVPLIIVNADLLSESLISAQAQLIADTNTALSTQFDVATDYTRILVSDCLLESNSQLGFANERSRDFFSEQAAAFSFEINSGLLQDSVISTNPLNGVLFAVISNTAGADLIIETFAGISIIANYITENTALSQSLSSQNIAFNVRYNPTLNYGSNSFISTNEYFGTGRPWNVTGYPTTPIVSVSDNWSAFPSPSDPWMIEFLVSGTLPANGTIFSIAGLRFYTEGSRFRVRIFRNDSVAVIAAASVTSNLTNPRITILKEAGTDPGRLGIYVNGSIVGGSNTNGFGFEWLRGSTNRLNFPSIPGVSIVNFNFRIGDTYNYTPASSTLGSYFTPQNSIQHTRLLLNSFTAANSGRDDTRLLQTATVNLSAQFGLTATISGPQKVQALLSANANLVAVGSTFSDINLIAFANSQVELDSTRLRFFTSLHSGEFNLTAVNDTFRDVLTDLICAAETLITGDRTRIGTAEVFAISEFFVQPRGTVDFVAVLASEFSSALDVDYIVEYSIDQIADTELIVNYQRIRSEISQTAAELTLLVDPTVIRSALADLAVQSFAVTIFDRFITVVSEQTVEFSSAANAFAVYQTTAQFVITTDSQQFAVKTVSVDLQLTIAATLSANVDAISNEGASVESLFDFQLIDTKFTGVIANASSTVNLLVSVTTVAGINSVISPEFVLDITSNAKYSQQSQSQTTTNLEFVINIIKQANAEMFVTADISVISFERQLDARSYIIPGETNLWTIESESRRFKIRGETRTFKIRRKV